MISYPNRILQPAQIESLLENLVENRPLKILGSIARTGKYAQGVPWVWFECELTGKRVATFVSFADLEAAFWRWLEKVDVLLLAFWETFAIARVIWNLVDCGDWVYHEQYGRVQVVEKPTSHIDEFTFWIRYRQSATAIAATSIAFKY